MNASQGRTHYLRRITDIIQWLLDNIALCGMPSPCLRRHRGSMSAARGGPARSTAGAHASVSRGGVQTRHPSLLTQSHWPSIRKSPDTGGASQPILEPQGKRHIGEQSKQMSVVKKKEQEPREREPGHLPAPAPAHCKGLPAKHTLSMPPVFQTVKRR